MSINNLIIVRHGDYNEESGDLEKGEADAAGKMVAELLLKSRLDPQNFGILTSRARRAIQTGRGILDNNRGISILNNPGSKLEGSTNISDTYPRKVDGKIDLVELSSQTKKLLQELRLRMEKTGLGIILVGHEPSIIGLSNELNLGITRDDLLRRQKLPLLTTLN